MTVITQTSRNLERIICAIGELPSSPSVVNLVMGMTSDLNTDIRRISKTLSSDQSLTAKVLKLSNSSFYGRSKGVATLDEAILILGFFTLRSLVVATATSAMFKNRDPESAEHKLWEHSLATAMASRMIAARVRPAVVEEAYIAGLMHDLGKLILLQKNPKDYGAIISEVEKSGGVFSELELKAFGFTHSDLGQALLEKWSFPPELCDAIRDHHTTLRTISNDAEQSLACIVNLANVISKKIGVGFKESVPEDLSKLESARALQFSKDDIDKLEKRVAEAFSAEKHLFA